MAALDVARVAQVARVPGGSMEGSWLAFDELLDDLDCRIVAAQRRLDDVRPAVAASMLARSVLPLVVTPTAVAWSLYRAIPDLRAANLLVGFADGLPAAVGMRTPGMVGPASVELPVDEAARTAPGDVRHLQPPASRRAGAPPRHPLLVARR